MHIITAKFDQNFKTRLTDQKLDQKPDQLIKKRMQLRCNDKWVLNASNCIEVGSKYFDYI